MQTLKNLWKVAINIENIINIIESQMVYFITFIEIHFFNFIFILENNHFIYKWIIEFKIRVIGFHSSDLGKDSVVRKIGNLLFIYIHIMYI